MAVSGLTSGEAAVTERISSGLASEVPWKRPACDIAAAVSLGDSVQYLRLSAGKNKSKDLQVALTAQAAPVSFRCLDGSDSESAGREATTVWGPEPMMRYVEEAIAQLVAP